MKKELKLLFTIFTCCLAIFSLCFGVYASVKVTYQVNGNIHYEIDNAYVDIETRVYSSTKLLNYANGATIANALVNENLSNLTLMATNHNLTLKSTHKQTSLGDEFNSTLSSNLSNINYSSNDGYAYFIVVNITNKTSELTSAILQDEITLPQNSWCYNTGYIKGFDNTTTNNNIVFAFGLDDPANEIDTSFNFGININLGELMPTTEKYTINEGSGTITINDGASGVVILGKGNETATGLTLSSQSKNITSVYALADCGDPTGQNHFITGLTVDAFCKSTNLQKADLSNCLGITEILNGSYQGYSKGTFGKCNNLVSMVLPNNLQSIGSYAFSGCYSLKNLIIPNSVVDISNGYTFYDHNYNGLLLENIVYTRQGDGYSFENGVITIHKLEADPAWFNDGISPLIQTVIFSETAEGTEIGTMSFQASNIKSISLPDGITKIGESAFRGCHYLTQITIPQSVTGIGNDSFYMCTKLNNVILDNISLANAIRAYYEQGGLVRNLVTGGTVSIKCTNVSEITSLYFKNKSEFTQSTSFIDNYVTFIKI